MAGGTGYGSLQEVAFDLGLEGARKQKKGKQEMKATEKGQEPEGMEMLQDRVCPRMNIWNWGLTTFQF